MVNKFELIANCPDHGCFTGKNHFCRVPNVHVLILYLIEFSTFFSSSKFLMWNSSNLRTVNGRLQDFTLMLCATDRLLLSL